MSVLIKKITQRHSYGAIIIQEFNKIGLLAHEIWEGIEEFFFDYNNEGTLINMRIICPDGKTDDVKIVDSKERSILPPDEYKYDDTILDQIEREHWRSNPDEPFPIYLDKAKRWDRMSCLF